MMKLLYTIGYEGRSVDDFIATLCHHNITRVIDVRRNPISRKPGFSKSALSRILAESGIEYTHLVELGTPDPLRKALRLTVDYEKFFDAVDDYLISQQDALQTALDLALSQNCVLLCFERNPQECHRISIAVSVARMSHLEISVEHLGL
jgi:uncharacterized protein (DUF488 family)